MNNRALQAVPLALLLLLVLLTFWLNQVVQPTLHRGDGKDRHDPDIIIEKFTAQKLSPVGDVQYVLSAQKMQHYPDDNSSTLADVALLATPPNQARMKASATQGQLLDGGDTVLLEGNVVIQNESSATDAGMIARTEKMTILPKDGIARSDSWVRVSSSDGLLTAERFEMNNQTHRITLNHVKGTFQKTGAFQKPLSMKEN